MVPELNIQHKVISVMELLQIGIFERFVAANTPKKYRGGLKLLFLDGKKFGFMSIRSLSSEIEGPQHPRCGGGGPPLLEMLVIKRHFPHLLVIRDLWLVRGVRAESAKFFRVFWPENISPLFPCS